MILALGAAMAFVSGCYTWLDSPTTTTECEISGTDQRTAHLNYGTDPDRSSNVIPHTVKLSEFTGSNRFSLSARVAAGIRPGDTSLSELLVSRLGYLAPCARALTFVRLMYPLSDVVI